MLLFCSCLVLELGFLLCFSLATRSGTKDSFPSENQCFERRPAFRDWSVGWMLMGVWAVCGGAVCVGGKQLIDWFDLGKDRKAGPLQRTIQMNFEWV